MPRGGRRKFLTVTCETCGIEYQKESRNVKPCIHNYCCRQCNPAHRGGYEEKLTLVKPVIDGDNDPTPQVGCKLPKSAWLECGLPVGSVLVSKRTKTFFIVVSASRIAKMDTEYKRPGRFLSEKTIFASDTAWHNKQMVCPGVAQEV